jgi:hypothetical protein
MADEEGFILRFHINLCDAPTESCKCGIIFRHRRGHRTTAGRTSKTEQATAPVKKFESRPFSSPAMCFRHQATNSANLSLLNMAGVLQGRVENGKAKSRGVKLIRLRKASPRHEAKKHSASLATASHGLFNETPSARRIVLP